MAHLSPTLTRFFTGAVLLFSPGLASAGECTRPDATVQTSEQSKLEGEVKVTVMNFGGSAGASGEKQQEWESQLPSQSAVDNQWYLFYLCQEYEARRISRDQYCSISGGIWERIVGHPVSMGECASRAVSTPVAAAGPVVAPTAVLAGAPADAASTPTASASTASVAVKRGRWSALDENGRAVDVFGPVRLGGEEIWYSETDGGCLSVLHHVDNAWVESILVGQCTPWPALNITATDSELTLDAGNGRLVLDFVDPAPGRVTDGRWVGSLSFALQPQAATPAWLQVASALVGSAHSQEPSSFPIALSVDVRGGSIDWEGTSCKTQLVAPRTGAGWVQLTERSTDPSCVDGAKVTVQMLSGDAVLVQWSDGSRSAQGVLRPD